MDIGSAIRLIRKEKGIRQNTLAQMCGLSTNAMCSIEKGLAFPSRETMEKICKSLDIPVSYLLFFSITEDDVPAEKRAAFLALRDPLKTVLLTPSPTTTKVK